MLPSIRNSLRLAAVATFSSAILMSSAWAGNPHFVGKLNISTLGNTLTVSGKEAGLGNETQVNIQVTALAQCVNRGGNAPRADNKDEFAADGTFPVQNGKALFTLMLIADLQPPCSPPMTIEWSDIEVCDIEHDVCVSIPGPISAE